jgi:hypothetical protein
MTSYPSDINSYTLLYFHQILRFVNQWNSRRSKRTYCWEFIDIGICNEAGNVKLYKIWHIFERDRRHLYESVYIYT